MIGIPNPTPICNMYSRNAYPSFLSTARNTIGQEQLQLSPTVDAQAFGRFINNPTVDAQAFGRFINNPMAVNIHGQPLRYEDSSNIRIDSHTTMDIDGLICEMRTQSDLAKSYSSGGQPPSIGDVRQMVISEPSGSNQMYSDGQPPSVNDVGGREPSQSEPSCTRYEGPDEHEVQQVISELNDGVYKRGAVESSNDITAYSGYDERTQDLVSRFDSRVSQSMGVPRMTFNFTDTTINNGGVLNNGVWTPLPQRFLRIGTNIKVYKTGADAISIDISAYSGYEEVKKDMARRFDIEGQLEDRHTIGWMFLYVDRDEDVLIIGDDPWQEFVEYVSCIQIISPQEVQQMRFDSRIMLDQLFNRTV